MRETEAQDLFLQARHDLMPGLGWCANWKPQAKNHARGLGNDADHVEGGWGLVWGTGEQLDIGIALNQHKAAPVSKQRGE